MVRGSDIRNGVDSRLRLDSWPLKGAPSISDRVGSVLNTGSNGTVSGFYPYGEDKGTAARPASTTSPYGAVTGFTYNDTASPPTHIAITNGHGTRTTLDGFGRTIKVETGTGTATNFTVVSTVDSVYGSCGCSPLGKLTQTSMPYAPGGTEVYTTYTYDGMGRTLTQTAPDGSVTTYAYAGNSVSVTDPAGHWKQYYMDTLGNVSMVVEPNPVANPASPPAWAYSPSLSNVTYHVTNYTYDVLKHLTLVSMPRYNASTQVTTTQTRTFNYTVSNVVGSLLLSATNPENGTVTYTYNTNNQIATRVDAKNQKIVYTYDSYDRVTEVQHFYYQSGSYVEDTSQRVNYTYDSGTYGQGRLTGITYQPMANSLVSSTLPTFSEAYTYTQPGSVASKQLSIAQSGYSGLSLTGSSTYDNEGKMTSVTYPSVSNHSGTYTTSYDSMARPSTLVDSSNNTWAGGVGYGPSNELLSLNNETRTYNSRLQLTSIVVTVGGVAQFSQQYVYPTSQNNNGKAIQQNDLVSGEQVQYQYDSLNRLILAQTTSSAWGQAYVYDGFGNLYQKNVTEGSAPTLSVTVNAATNQISGYGYDSNGNTTYVPGSSAFSMGYDVENRMTSATQSSTPQVLYAYDSMNRRIWKGTVNNSGVITAQEMYFHGPNGKKLGTYVAQFGSPGQWIATDLQVHFGGRRVAHWAGSTINTQVVLVNTTLDRVGSVRNAGISSSGSSFYPFGEDKGTAAPNDQAKFATYTRDSATGLDYAMNRFYSSSLGRFMTPDPYHASGKGARPQSWNRYAYTRGDPVNRYDPAGLDDQDPCAGNPNCVTVTATQDPLDYAYGAQNGYAPDIGFDTYTLSQMQSTMSAINQEMAALVQSLQGSGPNTNAVRSAVQNIAAGGVSDNCAAFLQTLGVSTDAIEEAAQNTIVASSSSGLAALTPYSAINPDATPVLSVSDVPGGILGNAAAMTAGGLGIIFVNDALTPAQYAQAGVTWGTLAYHELLHVLVPNDPQLLDVNQNGDLIQNGLNQDLIQNGCN